MDQPPAQYSYHEAFKTRQKPRGWSLWYTVALSLVAIVMLLLPLLYLGLVGLIGYGVVYHAIHNAKPILGPSGGLAAMFVYALPIAVGAVMIFFMLKPLMADSTELPDAPEIPWDNEVRLFAFVCALCRHIGAPVPAGLVVDCSVNASAGFRRRGGLVSPELVLHIGLPLVAGLTARQFAGILAHEFGHFTQSFAMRVTYLVRSINMWFARVVFERDERDAQLDFYAEEGWLLVQLMAILARLFVRLGRGILWLLMLLGHAISSMMLRQMEFDADRYAAYVSGSKDFQFTLRETHKMDIAAELAFGTLQEQWTEGRLCNDISGLIAAKTTTMPAEIEEILASHWDEESGSLFDSHPSPGARARYVGELDAPGVLQLEGPATQLFTDFASLSKDESLLLYQKMFAPEEIANAEWCSVDELLSFEQQAIEESEAGARVWRHMLAAACPIPTEQLTIAGSVVTADAGERLASLRNAILMTEPDALSSIREYLQAIEGISVAMRLRELLQSDFPIQDPQEFGVPEATLHEAMAKKRRHKAESEKAYDSLEPFFALTLERASLCLSLLWPDAPEGSNVTESAAPTDEGTTEEAHEPREEASQAETTPAVWPKQSDASPAQDAEAFGASLGGAEPLLSAEDVARIVQLYSRQQVDGFVAVLSMLHELRDELRGSLEHLDLLRWYVNLHQAFDEPPSELTMQALSLTRRVVEELGTLRNQARRVMYPFEHAEGERSLGQFLVPTLPDADDPLEALRALEHSVHAVARLYSRCWGALARLVEAVEETFGLEPMDEPDDPFLDELIHETLTSDD